MHGPFVRDAKGPWDEGSHQERERRVRHGQHCKNSTTSLLHSSFQYIIKNYIELEPFIKKIKASLMFSLHHPLHTEHPVFLYSAAKASKGALPQEPGSSCGTAGISTFLTSLQWFIKTQQHRPLSHTALPEESDSQGTHYEPATEGTSVVLLNKSSSMSACNSVSKKHFCVWAKKRKNEMMETYIVTKWQG